MPDADTPVLDTSVLAELQATTGDDSAFVRDLVETYLVETPAQMDGISAAVAANDAEALVRPAHTLKSSSATLGAMRLSQVARELEMAGRAGALDAGAAASLEQARGEWDAALAAFRSWLAEAEA